MRTRPLLVLFLLASAPASADIKDALRVRDDVKDPLRAYREAVALPGFPASHVRVDDGNQGPLRIFELRRETRGAGVVVETITSRPPSALEDGGCAGRIELDVPDAPGGAQRYVADVGCTDGTSRVKASRTDVDAKVRWEYSPTLDQMMRARSLLLTDRSDGVRWYAPDLAFDSISFTSVVHGAGHAHVGGDRTVDRNLVVGMSMHSGYPTPGVHWDDLQIAVVDKDGNALSQLLLDNLDVGTHPVRRVLVDGKLTELAFTGLLKDAAGAWRFVDLSIPLQSQDVADDTGIARAWNLLVNSHTRKALATQPDGPLGHLWVDGREWISVDKVSGLVDTVLHKPASGASNDFSVNAAPPQAPLYLLAHAPTETSRVASDATVMVDQLGLFSRIPVAARRGWSHVHERITADGKTTPIGYEVRQEKGPYTTRVLEFSLLGGRRVNLVEQLVAVQNPDGSLEYGFKQVAQ